jgi:NADH dehydrogenase
MKKPHIVIVGAGFGGVYTARHLEPLVIDKMIDLTIVSKTNYFLFTPLLHEVATGNLRPTSVSESLREIFQDSGIVIYQDTVSTIYNEKNQIILEKSGKEIGYDYLVISTGAETNYYGIAGAKEYSLPLKNLSDATSVREKIINSFEAAALSSTPQDKTRLLSFVVVGGGATGVEVVAELAEFVKEIRDRYHKENKKNKMPAASVTLINSGGEILKPFNQKIRERAKKHLQEMGINILLGENVSSIEKGTVNLTSGKKISANTVIWAAGVSPTLPKFFKFEPKTVSGRLETDQFLRMIEQNNIFVLGDSAGIIDHSPENQPPMLAQVAVAQSEIVAENILAQMQNLPLSPFKYKSKGSFVSIGKWYAAGEIKGVVIYGKLAWWIWRTIYLSKFASWEKRIRIAFEWTLNLFLPRDTTKLS